MSSSENIPAKKNMKKFNLLITFTYKGTSIIKVPRLLRYQNLTLTQIINFLLNIWLGTPINMKTILFGYDLIVYLNKNL